MKRCKHCGTELTSGYVICSDCVGEVERLKAEVERLKDVRKTCASCPIPDGITDEYVVEAIEAHKAHTHLSTEVDELKKQVDYYKAEKRALIADLRQAVDLPCRYCKHNQNQSYCAEYCQYYYQDGKRTFPHFEWRGIKEEQAK